MKFISIISLLLLLASNSIAQEGTNFEDLTFQEALAKAKTTGKKLFIDCYTMQIHGQIYFPVKRMRGIFQQELYLHHERYARRRRD